MKKRSMFKILTRVRGFSGATPLHYFFKKHTKIRGYPDYSPLSVAISKQSISNYISFNHFIFRWS